MTSDHDPLLAGLAAMAVPAPGRRAGRVAIDLRDLTPFAASVLAAAMTIPRGETRPYGWIARQAGRPRAVRAAASALAANPVPLLIPCHRIVQADGVSGGYVFGTPSKEALLRHEGANLDEVRDLAAAGTRYLASDTTGIVCFPSCRNARRIMPAHRRGFASLAAAGRSGFRPCLHCQP
jgi:O-6-methylguanine DNA methyltransferase